MTLADPRDHDLADALTAARALAMAGDIQGIRDLETIAIGGSAAAMHVLAEEYAVGAFRDPDLSEHWFRSAVALSPTDYSIFRLGQFLYAAGRDEEAKAIFASGANAGFGLCMYWLARVYLREPSRSRDAEIRQLLEGASAQGYAWATRRLAALYLEGRYGLGAVPRGALLVLRTLTQLFPLFLRDPDDIRVRLNTR